MNVYYYNKDNISYQAFLNYSLSRNIADKKSLDAAIDHMAEDFLHNDFARSSKKEVIDSTIGGSNGKFIHLFNPEPYNNYDELSCFLTYQEGPTYAVQVAAVQKNADDMENITTFFNSATFKGKQYSMVKTSSVYRTGYKTGGIAFIALVALVIFCPIKKVTKER